MTETPAGRCGAIARWCRRTVDCRWFEASVLTVIIANAVLLGLETASGLMAGYGTLFLTLNVLFQAAFVAEILIRLTAYWPRPWVFFRSGWNVYDFVIVAASMIPTSGASTSIGRLLRLLRVTRLVSLSPGLRLIVSTMLTSIPSMGHVVMLLGLLVYVYAVLGYHFFHTVDPTHWGSLTVAALSLFQVITLEGWADLQKAVILDRPWSWLYFASFIVVAVFVVINLFIAVVINNLELAKEQERRLADAQSAQHRVFLRIDQLREELRFLEDELRHAAPSSQQGRRQTGNGLGNAIQQGSEARLA